MGDGSLFGKPEARERSDTRVGERKVGDQIQQPRYTWSPTQIIK
jgi:hypothetical protein